MSVILLLIYAQAQQIIIHGPQFCATYRQTFQKVARDLNLTIGEYESNYQSEIILNNSIEIINYQWDIFESDIIYWLELFFYHKFNTPKVPIQNLNQIQENLLIYYGNNQTYYSTLIKLAFHYPLYYFVNADPIHHKLHNEFFIQNYSIQQNYIIIRRKQDHYDNILLIENVTQIPEFIETYGQPFQQQYLTMRQIKHLQIHNQSRTILYINFNIYQYEQQKQIMLKQIDQYRQSKNNQKNVIFIITEPIFMAKTLLQRFLYKEIKNGPYLIYLQFNKFKFEIFSKEWTQYHISQWIKLFTESEQKLQTLNQYLQLIPYTTLSQQNIKTKTKNKIHSIALLEIFRKQKEPPNILLVRLIPYCYKSFMHFAQLSQLNTDIQILYSVNEQIDGEESILWSKNGSKIIDLNADIGQQLKAQ